MYTKRPSLCRVLNDAFTSRLNQEYVKNHYGFLRWVAEYFWSNANYIF
jgi:hypothetical protein